MIKTIFLAGAASLLLVSAAAAQPSAAPSPAGQTPSAAQIISAWDTDHDGGVSPAEWTAAGRPDQAYPYVDTDSDGKITEAELAAAIAMMQQQRQAAETGASTSPGQ